jgi:hypothetical protein
MQRHNILNSEIAVSVYGYNHEYKKLDSKTCHLGISLHINAFSITALVGLCITKTRQACRRLTGKNVWHLYLWTLVIIVEISQLQFRTVELL